MKKASETLTPLVLELGGKDAMIVCKDADLTRAASGALWAGFSNCGQSCAGVERIYVEQEVYNEFLEILRKKVENLRIGIDGDHDVDVGPMTTETQKLMVQKQIDDAISMGAIIFAKSDLQFKNGNFLPAIILTNVNHDMQIMKEETFGPVVCIMSFNSVDQAVMLANDSIYGLTTSVWTKDAKKANEMAKRIEAGTITINDHLFSHACPEAPWGGFKNSGIGRTHGRIGFEEMTQPKVVVKDIFPWIRQSIWWYPYNKTLYRGIRAAIYIFFGKSLIKKIANFGKVLRIFPRLFRTSSIDRNTEQKS